MGLAVLKRDTVGLSALALAILLMGSPASAQAPQGQPQMAGQAPAAAGSVNAGAGTAKTSEAIQSAADDNASAFTRWCQALSRRFMARTLHGIERSIQLTQDQKPTFDELNGAVVKARDTLQTACPSQRLYTLNAQLDAIQKRLEARLEAIKTVRPALDKLYASLTDEQKARYAALSYRTHDHMRHIGARAEHEGRGWEQRDLARSDRCDRFPGCADEGRNREEWRGRWHHGWRHEREDWRHERVDRLPRWSEHGHGWGHGRDDRDED